MNSVGFITHPDFLKHDTGPGHPERPGRLAAILDHLKSTRQWERLVYLEPTPASHLSLKSCHDERYLANIRTSCESGERLLDEGDTVVCRDSYRIAALAAGAGIVAVDEVMKAESAVKKVFCAVRPPGHHAESSRVMGFCLLNNIAIAARYAQKKHGVEKAAIVDWDVHHGNGTQEIFWRDPSVLYIILHQFPLWPGTGAVDETGADAGEGFTVNCPVAPGSGEDVYLREFQHRVLPALESFRPQILFISAGFDAHKDDPLANIELTDQSFAKFTTMLCDTAERYCDGRIVSVLEGGYDLHALSRSVEAHLTVLQS